MALIFHEGIPGCGKTYEAVAKHLIPALKKGRHVFARIDGLNHEQLAKLAGITLERCQDLLHTINEDQVKAIDQVEMPIASLVMIDEIQNYFPDTRAKLSEGITKFVAEQRHKGLDIVAMGQDLKDVHKIWRRRVDQKVLFHKLDMLGSAKYRWTLFKAVGPEKFKEVSKGTEEYDKSIFGAYKSFESGAEDAQKYDDKRATIWSSTLMRRVLPIAVIVGIVAIGYLIYLFKFGGLSKTVLKEEPKKPIPAAQGSAPRPAGAPAAANAPASAPAPEKAAKKGERDYLEDLSERYRLRLSAVLSNGSKVLGFVEWVDDGNRVKERLSLDAIHVLGYAVSLNDALDFAVLSKGAVRYVATQFPTEPDEKVSVDRNRQVRNEGLGGGANVVSFESDGYGVLGKAGPGVRAPGGEAAPAQRPANEAARPRVPVDSQWRAS